ncbi:peroxiredoxin [Pseudorhodoferax soli]|uniref:thioredoxin-dependent peroxiredoxin n=1 Tax=Pseudorhodoferax soli TaxID=545864 RepID=A0A368XMF7_9BURK|nr:peroxiredoxin [Pseudorhodoferax soli]
MNLRLSLRRAAVLAACALSLSAAQAALKPGDAAPGFTTEAALGGKAFRFQLSEALAKGPVVLYFFPKAFTQGCTVEAHLFAEASDRFTALGATVVGVSADSIDTLKRFSVEACRDKFAVAGASAKTIEAYDARSAWRADMADRISYVIGKDGRIVFTHHGSDPEAHVTRTLQAVEQLAKPVR